MQLSVCKKYNRAVHSYLMHLVLTSDTIDPAVFVVKNLPITPIPTESSSMPAASSSVPDPAETGSSSSSGPEEPVEGSSSSGEPETDCDVIAQRILVSIASLADINVLGLTSPGYGQLYRADKVSVITRSKAQQDSYLDAVIQDLETIARLQGLVDIPFEVVTVQDVAVGSNQNQIYPIR